MILVAFRHGNTFAPGAPVVCAGHQPGLPLVAAGVRQAQEAGRALRAVGTSAEVPIWTSPRLRAVQFAGHLQAELAGGLDEARPTASALHDARLDEIDYGDWTGKDRASIAARWGDGLVADWDVRGIWPADAGWRATEASVAGQAESFVAAVLSAAAPPLTIAVSHAGKLRYFARQVPDAYAALAAAGRLKVACGHAVVLGRRSGALKLLGYNVAPSALAAIFAADLRQTRLAAGEEKNRAR